MPVKRRRLESPRKSQRNIEKQEKAKKMEEAGANGEVNPEGKDSKKASPKQEYEIELIDDHRISEDHKRLEFFVKWKGYGL